MVFSYDLREEKWRPDRRSFDIILDDRDENIAYHSHENPHRKENDHQHLYQLLPFSGIGDRVVWRLNAQVLRAIYAKENFQWSCCFHTCNTDSYKHYSSNWRIYWKVFFYNQLFFVKCMKTSYHFLKDG